MYFIAAGQKTWPIAGRLDELFQETVVREGDGRSMGLTPTMIKFRSLEGPFIGNSLWVGGCACSVEGGEVYVVWVGVNGWCGCVQCEVFC